MAITYATFSEFTRVYSVQGITQAQINSHWLPEGALRVNEALAGHFAVPFLDNNHTARSLSIHFARLAMLERTRKKDDSDELGGMLKERIEALRSGAAAMLTDSGDAIYASQAGNDAFSTTQGYRPVFDMRDPLHQRVDPDYLDELDSLDD